MILVDLNESYQNIQKSTHIARKKVPLLWGQKPWFFIFGPKSHLDHLGQAKSSQIDLCYTTRQGLSQSPLNDAPWSSDRKKWGSKKSFFHIYGIKFPYVWPLYDNSNIKILKKWIFDPPFFYIFYERKVI